MVQLHQGTLLDPRHVAAADAELPGDFTLRPFFTAVLQAEAAFDDLLLALIENVQVPVDFALLDLELDHVGHVVRLTAQNINQRDFINL